MNKEDIVRRVTEMFSARPFAQDRLRIGVEREFITYDASRPYVMRGSLETLKRLAERTGWVGFTECGFVSSVEHSKTRVLVTTDAGHGQLEVVYPPSATIDAFAMAADAIMPDVGAAARGSNVVLLGLGRNPTAIGVPSAWIEKPRYREVRAALNPEFADETLETASDQTTVDARSPEHAIALVNIGNYLAPLIAALASNFGIFHGEVHRRELASRVRTWGRLSPYQGRVGMPTWFEDVEHYTRVLLEQAYLFHVFPEEGRGAERFQRSFFRAVHRYGEDEVGFARLLLVHIACVWWEARIRLNGCTSVEFRTPCRQPTEVEDQALTALYLGLSEQTDDALQLVKKLGHRNLRRSFKESAPDLGFDARVGKHAIEGPIRDMLDIARVGLQRRGHGEERYLDPLFGRLSAGVTPAEQSIHAYRKGGINGLLAWVSRKPWHRVH